MSVPLAEKLLQRKTFIFGTVKINKKFLLPQAKQKQKQDEIMSIENRSGVKFLKSTDKKTSLYVNYFQESHVYNQRIQGKNDKLEPVAVSFIIMKKKVLIYTIKSYRSLYYSYLRKTVK